MPELLWKAYIDFEVGLGETEKARELYERLLERTLHVKVQRILYYNYIILCII
jgi:crooked neck